MGKLESRPVRLRDPPLYLLLFQHLLKVEHWRLVLREQGVPLQHCVVVDEVLGPADGQGGVGAEGDVVEAAAVAGDLE